MKNKKVIYLIVAVGAVVVVGVLAVVLWVGKEKTNPAASEITAVYLTSGDIYFGKIDWFPWPRLKNVWYIQRGTDQKQQPQVGLAPFKGVFWTPIDEIYLNPKEIVFWTKIQAGTELAKALEDPEAFKQSQNNAQPPAQTTGTTSEGFKGPTSQPPSNP